jgi:hypothetical protein
VRLRPAQRERVHLPQTVAGTHTTVELRCDCDAFRSVPVGSVGGSPAGSDATLTRRHTQIASLPRRRRWPLLAWWVGEWLRVPLAAGGTSRSSGLTILWKRLPPGGKKLVPTRAGRCCWWKAGPGRPTRTVQVQQSCACAYVARCVSKPRTRKEGEATHVGLLGGPAVRPAQRALNYMWSRSNAFDASSLLGHL